MPEKERVQDTITAPAVATADTSVGVPGPEKQPHRVRDMFREVAIDEIEMLKNAHEFLQYYIRTSLWSCTINYKDTAACSPITIDSYYSDIVGQGTIGQ